MESSGLPYTDKKA